MDFGDLNFGFKESAEEARERLKDLSSDTLQLLNVVSFNDFLSLDLHGGGQLDISVVEFEMDDTVVEIVPKFNNSRVLVLDGGSLRIGPFMASVPIKVPLWVAKTLLKLFKCHLQPAEFYSIKKVQDFITEERNNKEELQKLPDSFFILTRIFLKHKVEPIDSPGDKDAGENLEKINSLVNDLWLLRYTKVRTIISSLYKAANRQRATDISNYTRLERKLYIPLVKTLFEFVHKARKKETEDRSQSSAFASSSFRDSVDDYYEDSVSSSWQMSDGFLKRGFLEE